MTNHIESVIPTVYATTIKKLDIDPMTDLSRTGSCSQLTMEFIHALSPLLTLVHREMHIAPSGAWHMLVAHEASPSQQELVTDLCPWQFTPDSSSSGYFHGTRLELQRQLYENGANEDAISLVGLGTLVKRHYLY